MTKQIIKAKNKEHLQELIEQEIRSNGYKCDLNFIDVSDITNMYCSFFRSNFNGDVSKWDTEKVEDIEDIFYQSKSTQLPYWAKYNNKAERDKAIFEYKKALQEHEDLTNCINNYAITSKKKFKI